MTFTQIAGPAFGTMGVPGEVAAPPALARTMEVVRTVTKRTCSIDDCDKPVHGQGWCNNHYMRWKRHGDPLGVARRLTLVERFWAKVDRRRPDECWHWLATGSRNGYGQFDGNMAHRLAYELEVGPIPEAPQRCSSGYTRARVGAGEKCQRWAEPGTDLCWQHRVVTVAALSVLPRRRET